MLSSQTGAGANARARLFLLCLVLALAGCRARTNLPPLPDVATRTFAPVIRSAIDAAFAEARAHPKDAGAVGRLGMVLHAHGQTAAARVCYRRASLLDSKNFDWIYYRGIVSEGPEAVESLREALRRRDYVPARLRLGEALLAAGDNTAAAEVYRGQSHPAALFGFARATNDPAYYERAIAAFPQYGGAIFALAQHYQRSGRAADARRLMADYARYKMVAPPVDDPLLRAVNALDKGPDKLIAQAKYLAAEGRFGPAIELELKALELDPRLVQAHVNLITLYGRLDNAKEAESHYRQALALNANAYEAYYNFGVLCYRTGRRAEAQAAFAKTLSINPGYADAHNNLGALLQEQGRLQEAAAHFRKAVDLQPGLRLARFHLGRIYANQRRYREAIEQFEQAAAVDDEATPRYLYALGATRARAGDKSGAAATLAEARRKALAWGQTELARSIGSDLDRLR
ncbi:MAG: tetratricopeptide repeat protein [Acidobacteriota bacterium]